MKKLGIILAIAFLLTGCGARETFETVSDNIVQSVMGQQREVELTLPSHALAPVVNSDDGSKLYLCEGYILTVQTLSAGDLNRTTRSLSGFGAEQLTVIETVSQDWKRYEWVWTAAGEGGDQMGRALVLDDGSRHYCLTAMADAQTAGTLEGEWSGIFSSFRLL